MRLFLPPDSSKSLVSRGASSLTRASDGPAAGKRGETSSKPVFSLVSSASPTSQDAIPWQEFTLPLLNTARFLEAEIGSDERKTL